MQLNVLKYICLYIFPGNNCGIYKSPNHEFLFHTFQISRINWNARFENCAFSANVNVVTQPREHHAAVVAAVVTAVESAMASCRECLFMFDFCFYLS